MGNAKSRSQNRGRSSSKNEAREHKKNTKSSNNYERNFPKCRCNDVNLNNDQDDSSNDGEKSNNDNESTIASFPLCYSPPAQGLPPSKSSNKKSSTKKSTAEETSSDETPTEDTSAAENMSYSYPEFPPSCCGIYYVQCPMCCQVYPSCCESCPNCGHTPRPPGNGEAQMPASAYCPCCCQEAPKANGLQNLCSPCLCPCVCPCVCYVCADESASNQTQCIQLPPTCCQCCCPPPIIYICDNPNTTNAYKSKKDQSSTKKKVTNWTCDSDESTDEPKMQSCTCDNERSRSPSPTEGETISRRHEKNTRETRYTKERRQRSSFSRNYAESNAGGSCGKEERSPIYGKAQCPCGCEVDIKNITFQLPICNDEDVDYGGSAREHLPRKKSRKK
uniref:Uncharacterized protein n=1 Tax=Ceratitis capitata TaxID=7213 RepID=W8B212_CERCA